MNDVLFLVILFLTVAVYAAYLARFVRADGARRRQRDIDPPRSHHRDLFDPAEGPTRVV